jgi:hypothetical protein
VWAQLILGATLSGMDYLGASTTSILIVGFLIASSIVSTVIIDTGRRLDAGRVYLELRAHAIDQKLERLWDTMQEVKSR